MGSCLLQVESTKDSSSTKTEEADLSKLGICLGVTIHVPIYSKPKKKIESCFPDGVYRYINDLVPNNFQVPNLCIYLFGGCYMWDFCWLLSSIPSLGIPKMVI